MVGSGVSCNMCNQTKPPSPQLPVTFLIFFRKSHKSFISSFVLNNFLVEKINLLDEKGTSVLVC